jgi:hypothetical protein
MKSEILQESKSLEGRRVTISRDCGSYSGAQPYFTVARWRPKGDKAQEERYTPFLARAEALYRAYLRDETDPEQLKAAR